MDSGHGQAFVDGTYLGQFRQARRHMIFPISGSKFDRGCVVCVVDIRGTSWLSGCLIEALPRHSARSPLR